MRKRSGQVHSRESSATLQLTVSLLYQFTIYTLRTCCGYAIICTQRVFLLFGRKDEWIVKTELLSCVKAQD